MDCRRCTRGLLNEPGDRVSRRGLEAKELPHTNFSESAGKSSARGS